MQPSDESAISGGSRSSSRGGGDLNVSYFQRQHPGNARLIYLHHESSNRSTKSYSLDVYGPALNFTLSESLNIQEIRNWVLLVKLIAF